MLLLTELLKDYPVTNLQVEGGVMSSTHVTCDIDGEWFSFLIYPNKTYEVCARLDGDGLINTFACEWSEFEQVATDFIQRVIENNKCYYKEAV